MHIYYINLDHRVDRRKKIESCLNKLPVTYERVPAVLLPKEELFDIGGKYQDILGRFKLLHFLETKYQQRVRGIIGCYLSHVKTYELAQKSQKNNFLILEDDVTINPYSLTQLKNKIKFLSDKNWDIFRSVWRTTRVNNKSLIQYQNPVKIETNNTLSKYRQETKTNNSIHGGSHFTYVNASRVSNILDYLNSEYIFGFDAVLSTAVLNVYIDHLSSVKHERPGSPDIPKTK